MLQFFQDEDEVIILLTLTELVTIATPYYLFVFTHVTTKEEVIFVKAESDDESEYPQRYNQFTINAVELFEGKQPGEWHYKIYEQDNDTNTEPELSGTVLEYGKLILDRAVGFEFTMYDQAQTFKTYNG
jgi:hypothetical protein